MNVYEDKYLREKVNRIIARQKEGKIVIAAHKDGSGVPTREDLGQEMTRATYPYDYAVGKAGFLNCDSELGATVPTSRFILGSQPGHVAGQVGRSNSRHLLISDVIQPMTKRELIGGNCALA